MVTVFHLAGGFVRKNFPGHLDDAARCGDPLDRRGDCAGGADLQHPGALAGRGSDVGAGRAGGLDSASRPGAANADAAAVSGVDALRTVVLMEGHIGEDVYLGRFLFVWAILYLTFFLGSKRKIVAGILFAAAAIAATLARL